jgi:hypothetical protein
MKIPQKILFSKQDFSQRQRPSLTTDHIHSNTNKPVTPISTKVNKNQQPHTYGHSRKHIPTAIFRINSKRQKKKKNLVKAKEQTKNTNHPGLGSRSLTNSIKILPLSKLTATDKPTRQHLQVIHT